MRVPRIVSAAPEEGDQYLTRPICRWDTLDFEIYEPGELWPVTAGLYIFATEESAGRWRAIYVGKTESFAERLPAHERWLEAAFLGATHVHLRAMRPLLGLGPMEELLIKTLQPPLNQQR